MTFCVISPASACFAVSPARPPIPQPRGHPARPGAERSRGGHSYCWTVYRRTIRSAGGSTGAVWPLGELDSVAVTRGGGAGPWGNLALAGTIRLQSRTDPGTGMEGEIGGNTFGAGEGRLTVHEDLGRAHLTLGAAGHFGDGPYLIRADQRGLRLIRSTNDRGGMISAAVFRWRSTMRPRPPSRVPRPAIHSSTVSRSLDR